MAGRRVSCGNSTPTRRGRDSDGAVCGLMKLRTLARRPRAGWRAPSTRSAFARWRGARARRRAREPRGPRRSAAPADGRGSAASDRLHEPGLTPTDPAEVASLEAKIPVEGTAAAVPTDPRDEEKARPRGSPGRAARPPVEPRLGTGLPFAALTPTGPRCESRQCRSPNCGAEALTRETCSRRSNSRVYRAACDLGTARGRNPNFTACERLSTVQAVYSQWLVGFPQFLSTLTGVRVRRIFLEDPASPMAWAVSSLSPHQPPRRR